MSICEPTWTQVPNCLFEKLPLMKEAEMRVMLFITRMTAGFHRRTYTCSFSWLEKKTGLTRPAIWKGIQAAESNKWLIVHRQGRRRNTYELNIGWKEEKEPEELVNEPEKLGNEVNQKLGNEVNQKVVNEVNPEKEREKETDDKRKGANVAAAASSSDDKITEELGKSLSGDDLAHALKYMKHCDRWKSASNPVGWLVGAGQKRYSIPSQADNHDVVALHRADAERIMAEQSHKLIAGASFEMGSDEFVINRGVKQLTFAFSMPDAKWLERVNNELRYMNLDVIKR